MARALGIDYGMKRTGVSVTDPLKICVNALETIETEQLVLFIETYLKKEDVDLIVLGEPFHADGQPTPLYKTIHALGDSISSKYKYLKVEYQDEYLTSKEAVKTLINKGTPKQKRTKAAIDKISAVLILQKYLNHI